MKVKCSRCGKETNKEDSVLISQNDCFNGYEESYWCKSCYENFVSDIENSEKAFKDVKPKIEEDLKENLKKFVETIIKEEK